LLLLAIVLVVLGVGAVADVLSRSAGVEGTVRRYFSALEVGDVDGALSTLATPVRERDVAFVENGVGNRYRVVGVAVRQPSLLARFAGLAPGPNQVTVFLDVTQQMDDARWQAGPTVGVREQDGRWVLERPPLAPE
jgi:hypothetical protein